MSDTPFLRTSCQLQPWSRAIHLRLAYRQAGKLQAAHALHFSEVEDGQHIEPALCLQYEEAQNLMDELWTCGLRPSEGTGSAGALAATEKHLKDMQAVAFKLLDGVATK
ncbi:hypothetical protein [Undibacterium sp. TJN19]|uniref:hypothetical protein n=1 Tax=Undibacterium sp. TJN19 TaxID=3413055 RepID=UPI003BEF92F8